MKLQDNHDKKYKAWHWPGALLKSSVKSSLDFETSLMGMLQEEKMDHNLSIKDLEELRDWMAKNLNLVNAEIKAAQVLEMQKVHRESGSKDDYGLGMYNGMEFALAIMKNCEPKYLTLEELKRPS